MKLIAHRGFAGEQPENSLAAFRAAVADGADGVELDVRWCASGELVVCHDETVDRVTDGSGRVADLALADLRTLSVRGSGEGVPTLDEVFEALPTEVEVHVELKEVGTAADAAAVAGAHDHAVVVSSFHPDALDALREADPAVDRALLFADRPAHHLGLAVELDCAFVHPERALAAGPDLVADAHDRGLGVNAWTVLTRAQADRLREIGVDGVIADYADVA